MKQDNHTNDRALGLSTAQVTGSALAAMSGAFFASWLGTTGTLVGAAVGSVVATVGAAIYTHSLRRTGNVVKRTAVQVRHGALTVVPRPDPGTASAGPVRDPNAPRPSEETGEAVEPSTPATRIAARPRSCPESWTWRGPGSLSPVSPYWSSHWPGSPSSRGSPASRSRPGSARTAERAPAWDTSSAPTTSHPSRTRRPRSRSPRRRSRRLPSLRRRSRSSRRSRCPRRRQFRRQLPPRPPAPTVPAHLRSRARRRRPGTTSRSPRPTGPRIAGPVGMDFGIPGFTTYPR